MKGEALGIIETYGLVPAVECADAALKAAEVRLLGWQKVGRGLVSVLISGQVSPVQVSVEAGRAAAQRVGRVVFHTVIPRAAEGMETVLFRSGPSGPGVGGGVGGGGGAGACSNMRAKNTEPFSRRESDCPAETVPRLPNRPGLRPEPHYIPGDEEAIILTELARKKVTELRSLARKTAGFPLVAKKIKFARKRELLAAFAAHRQHERK